LGQSEIRTYTASERDSVVEFWRTIFPNAPPHSDPALDIQRKQNFQPELFLVAHHGQRLVGTCMGGFDGHRGWVYYAAVHPEFRRQGIASRMMHELESRMLDMGCPKVNLQVRGTTPEAILFYERMGYSVEKRTSMGKVLTSSMNGRGHS
jgi:ribosomal protein S18 acetylase RimI-like enzyme